MASEKLTMLLPDMGGGGAERVALTLINHFIKAGHSVDLLLLRATGPLLPMVPPEVEVVDLKADRIRNAIVPLARYLAKVRPAAIQASMWPLTVAAILARMVSRSSARIVVSDHAALPRQYEHWGRLHRLLLGKSIKLFYPLADARVVVSHATAREMAMLSGLEAGDFEVIYNPVDVPKEGQPDPEVEQMWSGARFRILHVGRMTTEKNQLLLLEAFAALPFREEARLIILGEGPLRQQLEQRAQELGIADRLVMPGFRPDPSPFYRSAQLFVLSSQFEGYPLVLIEAMHCGLTVVSTDCPTGPDEILGGGEFGHLVPCGDASGLANAIADAIARPLGPEKVKRRAEQLSANAADRYLRLMVNRL